MAILIIPGLASAISLSKDALSGEKIEPPSFFSRIKNLAAKIGLPFVWSASRAHPVIGVLLAPLLPKNKTDIVGIVAGLALEADAVGGFSKPVRLGLDGVLLATAAWGSAAAIQEGANRIFSAWQNRSKDSTLQTIGRAAGGAALIAAGAFGAYSCAHAIVQMMKGWTIFSAMDPEQQDYLLKHHGFEHLAEKKSCHAGILDGLIDKFQTRDPVLEELYRQCDVRSFQVGPHLSVCDAAAQAANGRKLDILYLSSHATYSWQNM
jgi:hypothetical protein